MIKKKLFPFLLLLIFSVFLISCEDNKLGENDVKVLDSSSSLVGKQYLDVVETLENWGFSNIEVVPVYDIIWGITKPGTTKKVEINGNDKFQSGDIFDKGSGIVITYSMPANEDPTKQNYTVTWKNYDGEIIKTTDYKYGDTPEYEGETPFKDGFLELSYVFAGWTPSIEKVTKDITYTAKYEEIDNGKYNLLLEENSRGSLNGAGTYYEKEVVTVTAESDKYLFQGWYVDDELISREKKYSFEMPSKNIVLKARFSSVEELKVGDTYYFGSYPNTKIMDSNLITVLSNLIDGLPSSEKFNDWNSFEYYSSSKKSHYQWYKDVEYEGSKYRAIYFEKYRSRSTTTSFHSQNNNVQFGNGYLVNEIYWFRFDEIEWKVLSNTGLDLKLIAANIVDSYQFYYTTKYHKDDEWGSYSANYYKGSDIRYWLNNNFYNTAFDESEQSKILINTVDNIHGLSGTETYLTYDKVYLLSHDEVMNNEYGYNFITTEEDENRMLKGTDYALSQGLSVYDNGYSRWWLRTPRAATLFGVYVITEDGRTAKFQDNTPTDLSHYGVTPVITINVG